MTAGAILDETINHGYKFNVDKHRIVEFSKTCLYVCAANTKITLFFNCIDSVRQ